MKKKTGITLSILTVVVLYLFLSSTIIVKPGTVTIVKELQTSEDTMALVSRPLINEGRKNRLFFKQPVIPGTGIGYIEEVYSRNNPYSFETSFALYTLDQLTGNREDQDKVRAYTISGTIGEINNWESFLNKLNVEEVNRDRSPYSRKYENRVEILADQLKFLLRTGSPEQYYPYGAGSDEPVMNLGQKISWLSNELVTRRNFLAGIQDKYGFEEPDFYKEFLMSRTPWYWVMGVDRYEELINQAKNLREYEQSIYSQVISRKGNANKYIANEDYLYLINMMGKVNYYEESLISSEETMENLQKYKERVYSEIDPLNIKMGEALARGFLIYLENGGRDLVDIRQEDMTQEISLYINTDLISALEKAINYEKLLLNIEYLPIYETQILGTYQFSDEDNEQVDQIVQYILSNYDELLKKENWENYMNSVNREFNRMLEENPQLSVPDEKIQVLGNFKLYEHYLKNIEPSLKRHQISDSHYLDPLMTVLKGYADLFLADKDNVSQLLTNWLQNENAHFVRGAASLLSYEWQRKRTQGTLTNLQDFKQRELDPYIYFESRNYDLDESEKLWDAAIANIMNGNDLRSQRTFTFHKVGERETISSISEFYNVNPFDVFYENRFNMEFSSHMTRAELNSRLEYESFSDIFASSRDLELKRDQDIYIPGKEIYSDNWLDLHVDKQDVREYYINQYVFSNIEEMVADAFYEFVNKTDYVENLEQNYGVVFDRLDFSIEDRSFFSNPRTGEIDHDFMDLYYQKTLR